jgi:hypothetical protein
MKRNSTIICTMAALLMAGAALVSCTKESQPISGTFTLSVNASKGNPAMKDLALDDNTLNAKWKDGEIVTVYNITKGEALSNYLYVGTGKGGSNVTKLEGFVSGTIEEGDKLELRFLDNTHYGTQVGTLEYIAANCDYALDTVKVTGWNASDQTATTEDAVFNNKQAIVKFTLRNSDNTADRYATNLVVEVDGKTYTVHPATAEKELFVAIPGFSNKDVKFTATVEGESGDIIKTKTDCTFIDGKYYNITLKL